VATETVVHEVLRAALQRSSIIDVVVRRFELYFVLCKRAAANNEKEQRNGGVSHGVTLVGTGFVFSMRE
jgi:hypothetical protein